MAYNYTIEEIKNYLKVVVTGRREKASHLEDDIKVWLKISEACKAKRLDKILVLYDITGKLTTTAIFEWIGSPESFGWSRKFKLALVDLNEETRKELLFAETIAYNRGYTLKIFANENEALAWLLEQ
ncbi:MAG: hypothetical protein PVH88_01795 [Ignavibacteria bacterium]|jgi:hypothetical protein